MAKKPAAKAAAKPKGKKTAKTTPAELRPHAPTGGESVMLALSQLVASPLNPRKTFDKDALEDLAESIAAQGLLQNLVVRALEGAGRGNGHTKLVRTGAPMYEVIAGERRLRALHKLAEEKRWDEDAAIIACRILHADDAGALALALLENLQRQDVPPMEEAEGFAALRKLDGETWTTATIAQRIGKTQRYVQQRLSLVEKLDPAVQAALRSGEIELTHARALTVAEPKVQREAVDKIKAGSWGFADPERLSDTMLGKLPLVSKAPFPLDRYTGEIVDGPTPYGVRDGRRFADVAQFKALQKEVVDAKRESLAAKWAWVEVKKGESYRAEPSYGNYTKSSDRTKAGAVIFMEPDGGVVAKTGLIKVDREARAAESWEVRRNREQEERQAREAAEQRFLLALGERLADNPFLAMRLLLAHLLGAGILDEHADPTPMTRRFRGSLNGLLQDEDPTGNCRLRDDIDAAALLGALERMQNFDNEAWPLLAALVAEHLSVGWEGLDPILSHIATELGVEIPAHLRGDEEDAMADSGDAEIDEADIAEHEEAAQ